MSKKLLILGDLVVDLTLPVHLPVQPDRHQIASARTLEPGGAGTVAITARRMGMDVSVCGVAGADPFGTHLLSSFLAEGIDVGLVATPGGSTTTLIVTLVDGQRHTFIGSYGSGPALALTDTIQQEIDRADALYMPGYALIEPRTEAFCREVLRNAANTRVYLDAGPFPLPHMPNLLTYVDVLFVAEGELANVGCNKDTVFDHGIELLVIKQGDRGCTVMDRHNSRSFDAFTVDVVDTIGAGDCFDAAFIAAQLDGHPIEECAMIANAAGAASVQKRGAGRNLPTYSEIQKIQHDTTNPD